MIRAILSAIVVLAVGVMGYIAYDEGNTMTVYGIELTKPMFLIAIGVVLALCVGDAIREYRNKYGK